ncbi:MAG: OmpH family outer membrane protein [Candidatus Thioglobus sp.]|jgi:outer membrane protein|nr:OmpH family outer membrane protein [Candidatus Thioglobus sp.]
MRAFAILVLALLTGLATAESIKIGYLNIEEVVNNLTQYRHGNERIADKFDSRKKELLNLFKHIELLKEDLSSKSNHLTTEAYKNEINHINKLEVNFQKDTELWQYQLNQEKQLLLQQIELLINQAVERFAKEEFYDLILYDNVAFTSDKINDISNDVINLIETSLP